MFIIRFEQFKVESHLVPLTEEALECNVLLFVSVVDMLCEEGIILGAGEVNFSMKCIGLIVGF